MLTDDPLLAKILDNDLIGFFTAVDERGQPQTSPVWFVREAGGDEGEIMGSRRPGRLIGLSCEGW
jgi:hypothetical protein